MSFVVILLLIFPSIVSVYAQTTVSNCTVTDVGNVPPNQPLPANCNEGNGNWPFAEKSKTLIERIDQGQDLEYDTSNATIYAVADGTINLDHGDDPCDGGAGFGDTYPIEVLDTPIHIDGRTYTQIYYGHVNDTKLGRVTAGDAIAQTYDCVIEDGVYVPWLEIGFWNPAYGPVDGCVANAVTNCLPTQAGEDMAKYLGLGDK